jgi:hypothetical protein
MKVVFYQQNVCVVIDNARCSNLSQASLPTRLGMLQQDGLFFVTEEESGIERDERGLQRSDKNDGRGGRGGGQERVV